MRFRHALHAGRVAQELVGTSAGGMFPEALVPDLREVFLRDDEAGRRGRRAVVGHEVRPGLLQMETYRQGIDDLDLLDPRLEFLEPGAAVPLETELHVLGG